MWRCSQSYQSYLDEKEKNFHGEAAALNAIEENPKVKELAVWKQAKSKEEIKELNRKADIIESEISVADKPNAEANDQLSKLLQESRLKRDLL